MTTDPAFSDDGLTEAIQAADEAREQFPADAESPAKKTWRQYQDSTQEATFKIVIQVYEDKVWAGAFYGPGSDSKIKGETLTFQRPASKTPSDCVEKALRTIAGAQKWSGWTVPANLTIDSGADDW
jgi:hypothetical protein